MAGVDIIEGDLSPPALAALIDGAAAVVHLAGVVRGASRQDFDAVNLQGSASLLAALGDAPSSPQLLLVSSLAAREPRLSWYAASKRAAEDLLPEHGELDWTVLRPPAVYGPGDEEMLPVFELMSRGLATVPGSSTARLSLVHVDDLCAAVIACLQSDASRHSVFTLHDGKAGGYDWAELAALVGGLSGRRVRLWQVPRPLLDGVARCNLALARLTGRAPMLTPPKLRELRHSDWVVDNEAISAATGWQPRIGLAEGLAGLLTGR